MNRKEKRDMIAHKIAWQHTKYYDPLLSKESWCEIAAREAIDWADEHPNPQLKKEWLEKACEYLKNDMIDNLAFQGRLYRLEIIDGIIKKFRKYMEEQQ